MKETIFKDGEFFVGCNYWASHAGTNMWKDWRPDVVDKDFELLAKAKVNHLRIFPLWPDFQPLREHKKGAFGETEMRLGEDLMPFTEAGKAGVCEEMADRFETFCDLAQKHGLKLIVGLITGWMSGRLHAPEPFDSLNLLCDPKAIKWQIKFVKYMVRRFKNHPAIAAWDLGNECNALGPTQKSEEGYLWASTITMAIQTEDKTRPVVSGLHGMFPESTFTPHDLGEILDVVCTHPYPLFTPHCLTDAICEQKSAMHSVAETIMYRGLSGKPAFVEEIGNHCPMVASDENAAAYLNTVLYLLWSHNCLGLMWWCGFQQIHLTHTPYDWDAGERELGLFNGRFEPKPVLSAMKAFAEFKDDFEYHKLPHRIVDAVCIVNAKTDTWKSAYGTFMLAKQAGLDIEVCHLNDEIPESKAYILPSIAHMQIPAHVMNELLARVEKGAALYISLGNGLLSPFKEYSGMKALCRYNSIKEDTVELSGETFTFKPNFKIEYEAAGAKVLANDDEKRPVMSENKYGKGTIYFLSYPLEDVFAETPGVVSGKGFVPYYKFYKTMDKLYSSEKKVTKDNPFVAYTEHIADENTRIIVAVNCVPKESEVNFSFDGYTYARQLKNQNASIKAQQDGVNIKMQPNSAVVFEIKKK